MEFYISRYKDLKEKVFDVEIITPLFLAGANNMEAELRTQSFKGMIRFWWRAIYGNYWKEMKNREDKLFGSTENKSQLSIRIENKNVSASKELKKGRIITVRVNGKEHPLDILKYLSYGTNNRKYIKPGSKFKLILKYPKVKEKEILNALWALVNYGGLGSRCRNGFGSLYISEKQLPDTYKVDFNNNNLLKEFTSFSKKAELYYVKNANDWNEALSIAGLVYFNARKHLENRHDFTKRSLIAKPIIQSRYKYIRNGRHSKPYFIHVGKDKNAKYKSQILFLPYSYNDPNDRRDESEYLKVCNELNSNIQKEIEKLSK